MKKTFILFALLLSLSLHAENEKADMNQVSKAFGHMIGQNLGALGFDFDMDSILQGIQDAVAGKESPLSETECVAAISQAQESAFQKQADENLAKANEFMAKNALEKGIVAIEKERLHYHVDKEGTGAEVQAHFAPVIKYTGKFLDGSVFGASTEEEMITLDETIRGFSKGIVGMKEGEKRTLYIHPDMGYGASGYLPPNSLLTFEIEVVKANSVVEESESLYSNIHTGEQEKESEIAIPDEKSSKDLR
ncbi:MAG: FKBP-type peptidyl-prolyl cis-trans isomerase [Candidatus Algichlamydia australiensis]|nr:FKBP-type peptidyl-prolyl cis-trans isomerase [Chlamydiales bacterium]